MTVIGIVEAYPGTATGDPHLLARSGHEMSQIGRIASGSSPGCRCLESGLGGV